MSDIERRLALVRKKMRQERIDAWIVTGTDPHLSEYVAQRFRTRQWISGFTGSAGTVVITDNQALLWTDSRYFLQAERQLASSPYSLQRLDTPGVVDHGAWLAEHLSAGSRVGIDPATLSVVAARTLASTLSNKGLALVFTSDWFDELWEDRPPLPRSNVVPVDESIAGESRASKIQRIREACHRTGCTHTILSSLDDISWTLNLRGDDIPYNPVFFAYMLIRPDSVYLFTDKRHFSFSLQGELAKEIHILPYEEATKFLSVHLNKADVLYLCSEKTNMLLYEAIPKEMMIVEGRDFSTDFKAAKSAIELEGMRHAHVLDGIAMVRLLSLLSRSKAQGFSELAVAQTVHRMRSESSEYLGPSFFPIAGFGPHGALAHYEATAQSSSILEGDGLLVLDSGGQYLTGTTDITRTLLIGKASQEMKKDYTLVLKGNLALGAQRFIAGTSGYQLDVLARQFLWQHGITYGHGTGHGVGFRLCVHEGPQNISPKPVQVPLVQGMVISDEPGVYREGMYGVRIENLVAVKEDGSNAFGSFLSFEVLTLCPFERALIAMDLITNQERLMIDAYHKWVYEELSPFLEAEDRLWLHQATLPL